MNEPQDNGGLSAFDAPSTDAHVAGVDGHTCERFERALAELGASS
jgi:hypothetical protein